MTDGEIYISKDEYFNNPVVKEQAKQRITRMTTESRKVQVALLTVGDKVRWLDGEFYPIQLRAGNEGGQVIILMINEVTFHLDSLTQVEVAYEFPVYPAGTPVVNVSVVDRSIKQHIKCQNHPEMTFVTKDPFASRTFPGDKATMDAFHAGKSRCNCGLSNYILASDYKPQRND